ncbi:MAG: hypothetical protein GW763_00465 [Paraglaciecola sp.]|nr:hypothetical protein [Paraglaciecola sp.]NCT46466.1 hypothetical protein [Paraglaciecola sp.]
MMNCSRFTLRTTLFSLLRATTLLAVTVLGAFSTLAAEITANIESEVRFDDRSNRDDRYQYRLRFSPQLDFTRLPNWSMHAFVATGDAFSSSHNTLFDGNSDYLYIRRLFVRHSGESSSTELGIIPTFKGRVSSTGLAKDGWIAGVRHVALLANSKLEWVVGQLNNTQAAHALNLPNELDYVELEFSSAKQQAFNYELSLERMLGANFARAELRYTRDENHHYAFEVIDKLDDDKLKVIISTERQLSLFSQTIGFFAYYSYVDEAFGPRAELTEDFLATGHGLALEFDGKLAESANLAWFTKFEVYEHNTRFQLGIKQRFSF